MTVGLNAIFVVSNRGFICSNDGTIGIEADFIDSENGVARSINRTKILKLKNAFFHGNMINTGQEVTCLTRMNTGNVFHYDGIISFITNDNIVGVKLTSSSGVDRVSEIIKTIDNM